MGYIPPYLEITEAGGIVSVKPPYPVGTFLKFSPNRGDPYPALFFIPGDNFQILVSTGKKFVVYDSGEGEVMAINFITPDAVINSYNNRNVFIKPHGTGLFKYGTYAPGLAVCTGTIPMLDAAGNATRVLVAQP